jgi:nitrogen regulatory protein PII
VAQNGDIKIMKLVIGIIKPFKLNSVQNALHSLGVTGLTVYEAKGHGHQRGHSDIYGAVEYEAEFIPKLRVEVVVPDNMVNFAVQALLDSAKTGQSGDGRVIVQSIEQFIKIKTGERDKQAL